MLGVLLLASAVVAGAALFRDDDASDERRAAVSAYIVQVNTTQQALVVELERVNVAYRDLQLKAEAVPGQLSRVESAVRSLMKLRARFAGLRVPPETAKLHAELLRLVELQVGLAREVAGMVSYLPLQAKESRNVAGATARLRTRLDDATGGSAQSVAFASYRGDIGKVVQALERATAPPVLEASRASEIERLRRLDALAGQVGRALEQQQVEEIDRLFAAFISASAATGTSKAEREAVIAYNRRIAAITEQRAAVNAERVRLDLALQ